MPRRPAFLPAAAALCALTALTACQSSPEAGHPNTTPLSPTASATPIEVSTTSPTARPWTAEQQTAITAAKRRYAGARAAVALALRDPANADRTQLEAAGNGGAWLTSIVEHIVYLRDRSLYQAGDPKVTAISPATVDLTAVQPIVVLSACLDGSNSKMYYQKTGKPVPVATVAGDARHSINARLVYAPSKTGAKAWFLVEEKVLGKC